MLAIYSFISPNMSRTLNTPSQANSRTPECALHGTCESQVKETSVSRFYFTSVGYLKDRPCDEEEKKKTMSQHKQRWL